MANIDTLTPDNIDTTDVNVWNSIRDSTLGVFQWESSSAEQYYKELFSKNTIAKIKENNPNFDYMDLFSMGNGAIRPAGTSYRNSLASGEFKDNGHEVLNDFLKPTLGYLVYQEQIMEFLNQFCGYTMGEADIIRRGFSKKTGTEQYIPDIKKGFIKTMSGQYGVCKELSEEIIVSFIKVIEDSSDYLFSINHSQSYSYIGYVCAWLRYYYPLEFLTSLLNVNKDNQEKTARVFDYMNNFTDIRVQTIKFRFSDSEYSMDKENNIIYKGIESIKYMNKNISKELLELKDNRYDTFVDLLIDIVENTSCNSRQIKILIGLDFFSEFGGIKKLLNTYDEFQDGKNKYKKTYVEKTKEKRIIALREFEGKQTDGDINIVEKMQYELENLGYIDLIDGSIPSDIVVISGLEKNKWGTNFATLYRLKDGVVQVAKITKKDYEESPLEELNLIKVIEIKEQHKRRKVDNKWIETDEKELILTKWANVEV